MADKEYLHRQELLEYTKSLRQRREDKAAKQGFSVWGLIVAIVYLIWAVIPQASAVLSDSENRIIISTVFTHTHLAIILFCFYMIGSPRKPKSTFDYRVDADDSRFDYVFLIFIIFVTAFLPAYTSYQSLNSGIIVSGFQRVQLWINIIVSVSSVLILVTYPIAEHYRKKAKLPFTRVLPIHYRNKKSISSTDFVMNLIILILFIGNLIVVLDYVSEYPDELLMSFNISLLLIAIMNVFAIHGERQALADLNDLERDIILHGLNATEIVNRLEREFLGHQLAEWLDVLFHNVNDKSMKLNESINSIDDFIKDIERIDPMYKSERKARLDKFMGEITSNFEQFENEVKPLLNWLNKVDKQSEELAPEVVDILNKNRQQVSESEEKNKHIFEVAIEKLETLYPNHSEA